MFDFLKKKLAGWIGKSPETKKSGKKESSKKEIKRKGSKKEETAKKVSKKEAKKERVVKKKDEEIKTEKTSEKPVKEKADVAGTKEDKAESEVKEISEVKKEGFFSKLFKKKSREEELREIEDAVKIRENAAREAKKAELAREKLEAEEEVEEKIEALEKASEKPEKEEEKEEPKEEGFFRRLIGKISASQLTQEQFDEIFMELELTLLESNVALEAVDKIRENLAKSLVGQQFKKSEAEKKVLAALKDSILDLLIEPPDLIEAIKKKDGIFTILFFGINGTGKTTSIAKIAYLLKNSKISCALAAADTFRAASIEQLQTHGERIGVPVISSKYGADPASVAFDARKYAESHGIKVVLIDTAGRMYTKENLLKEMEKIVRVSQPDLKIFVGESITGNDAVEQARAFNESAGIDGIILSKADIDEKAGAILSVSQVTGKPIYFLGTGQEYGDIEVFSKRTVLKNLGLE